MSRLELGFGKMVGHKYLDQLLVISVIFIFGMLFLISASGQEDNQPPILNSLISDIFSPQDPGMSIRWTADAYDPDGDPLEYMFLLKGPSTGGIFEDMTGWRRDSTWTWRTSEADVGQNQIEVRAREASDEPVDVYDVKDTKDFVINEIYVPPPNNPPVVRALTASPESPQNAGVTVRWTATAADDEDAVYFKFVLDGSTEKDWSTEGYWEWDTSRVAPGDHRVTVQVRDGQHEGEYDGSTDSVFTINAPNNPPVVTSLVAAPESPQTAGVTVRWTATAADDEDAVYF
ncbi:MAG TPA: hypothetical protein PLQ49_02450, partial [Methanothrix sp.]|nr:hypothetical protein [Methanothrix sp.]